MKTKKEYIDEIYECMKSKGATYEDVEKLYEISLEQNKLLVEKLKEMRDEIKLSKHPAAVYKVTAYNTAIRRISKSKVPIFTGKQAMKMKGIGKKIGEKIDEILSTGTLQALEERTKESLERRKIIEKFMTIWGVGKKVAEKFYNEGYRSIEDITYKCLHSGVNMTETKDVYECNLSQQQYIGLKYYEDLTKKIPREEISVYEEIINDKLYDLDPKIIFNITGSYRRGLPESSDIDLIISYEGKKPKNFLPLIVEYLGKDILLETGALGPMKYMGVGSLSRYEGEEYPVRRIDIHYIPYTDYGVGLLFFTGSKEFNVLMRKRAKNFGYKLGNDKITSLKTGKKISAHTEEDVFKLLDLGYIFPSHRE